MAYVAPMNEDDEDPDKKKTVASGEGGVVGSTGSGGMSQAGTASRSGVGAGTGFTNLQTYLDANKEQAGQLADKLAGKLGEEATLAKTGAENVVSGFGQKVESSRVRPDDALVGEALSKPSDFVKDQDKVSRFKNLRDASYQGPLDLQREEGYDAARMAANKGMERSDLTQSEEGRKALLQDLAPTQGSGKISFNQLLLGADPQAREKLEASVVPFRGIGSYLDQQAEAMGLTAQGAKDEASKTSAGVREKLTGTGGAVPTGVESIRKRATDAETSRISQNQAIDDLEYARRTGDTSRLTDQELEMFRGTFTGDVGSLRGSLQSGAGMLPRQTQAMSPSSPESVATAEDYANMNALAELSGSTLPFDFSDASMAGSYKSPTVGLIDQPPGPEASLQRRNLYTDGIAALRHTTDPNEQNAIRESYYMQLKQLEERGL